MKNDLKDMNYNSYKGSDEETTLHEQMSMFDALGIKTDIVDIFTWQVIHSERTIHISGISSGYQISLTYEEFKERIYKGDTHKLSKLIGIIEGDQKTVIETTIQLCLDNLWRNYLIKGLFDPQNNQRYTVGLAYDIKTSHEQIARLNYLETHDDLTGLINFRTFDKHYNKIARFGVYPQALVIAKIDNLNNAFCALGPLAGNTLIKNVADVIKESFFEADAIGHTDNGEYCSVFIGKSKLEIETCIKEANMALHSMYLNLIKAEVSFGYEIVEQESDFCTIYQKTKKQLKKAQNIKIQLTQPSVIDSLNSIINKRTGWGRRAVRIQSMSAQVAVALGCSEDTLNELKLLSRISDIGLIGLSDRLLLRRTHLNEEEKKEYLTHIEFGRAIISGIETLADIEPLYCDIFKSYDEWKDAIAISSRIISGAMGVDDIMLTNNMLGYKDISKRMNEKRGKEYCPEVVDALLCVVRKSHYWQDSQRIS